MPSCQCNVQLSVWGVICCSQGLCMVGWMIVFMLVSVFGAAIRLCTWQMPRHENCYGTYRRRGKIRAVINQWNDISVICVYCVFSEDCHWKTFNCSFLSNWNSYRVRSNYWFTFHAGASLEVCVNAVHRALSEAVSRISRQLSKLMCQLVEYPEGKSKFMPEQRTFQSRIGCVF